MGLVLSNNPVLIIESLLGVHKGDSVPLLVQGVLVAVPLEGILYHMFIGIGIWVLLWHGGLASASRTVLYFPRVSGFGRVAQALSLHP